VFDGFERSKEWIRKIKPDVILLVYNDHAVAFSLDIIPTFALGLRGGVSGRRRGLGAAAGAEGESAIPSSPRTSRSR